MAVAGGLALGFAVAWNIANVGPAASTVADAYGIRLGAVGFLTTALFVTHFVVQVPAGLLIDRLGARRVGFAAVGAIVAGNAVALAAPSLALGIVARLVTGLGTGTGFVAGSDQVRAARASATAQGLYGGATLAGAGTAIGVVPLLTPSLGWRAPYVSSLLCAGITVALAFGHVDPPFRGRRAGGFLRVALDRRLLPFAVVHAASFSLSVVIGNWSVPLLVHGGHGHEVAGLVGALTLFSGLLTRPLGGWAIQRRPAATAPLLAASMLAGAGGTALLALSLPLGVRALGALVLGLAAGVPFAAAFTGAARLRPDAPAAAVGGVNSVATLVIVVATPLVGFSLPGHGDVGFLVIAALWAAATFAAFSPRLRGGFGAERGRAEV